MSFQAMTWAVKQSVGNATGKAILLMLANYSDESGGCFPSHERIADDCECGKRTVVRWMAVFEEMGLIKREQRRRSDGSRASDFITLQLHATVAPRSATKVPFCPSQSAILSKPKCQSGTAEPITEPITEPATKARDDILDEFEECVWVDFPRNPSSRKSAALKAYRSLDRPQRIACMRGVARYAIRFEDDTSERRSMAERLKYVPHLSTWINQRGWEAELETA